MLSAISQDKNKGVEGTKGRRSIPLSDGHLICTLISENQGLEKLRSDSNLRKISGPAHLTFFSVCHLNFFQVYGINLAFF